MRSLLAASVLLAGSALAPAFAESADEMAVRLQAATRAAQAAAVRAEDDALGCAQLQAEMAAIAGHPGYRAYMQLGVQGAVAAGAYGADAGLGLEFTRAFAPGLGYATVAALQGRNNQLRRNAETGRAEAAAITEAALPDIARNERLRALAATKQCEALAQ